ncbi:RDD family protein [Bacterioplanes sanyensis]|uniref:RDD family protein n=1 Tax=Bacterioplanes sanyensis TaxID=1249553 RepID=UPI0016761391|nr:RDD family protein [Bacterioplanes sanyensis]GGY42538.1 RDD family protein [Bacterioplanes sanyensis]
MSVRNYPTATLSRRLAAMLYDSLVLISLYIMAGFIVVALLKLINDGEFPGALPWSISVSIFFCVAFLYYTHSWLRGGQTIGMKAWRIALVNNNEKHGQVLPLQLSQCMLRCGCGFFSLLAGGLGFWWMLFDRQQRTWHDMASVTRIIHRPVGMD